MVRNVTTSAAPLLVLALALACSSGSDKSAPDASTEDTGGETDPGDGGDECDELDFPLAGEPPSIALVVDRSYSMALGDQWDMLELALTQITAQMDFQIRFALMMFPNENGLCMPAPMVPNVPFADQNAQEIADLLYETNPSGPGTPTAMSLRNAYLALLNEEPEARKFAVLATDGAPNCSTDPTMSCETCTSSDPSELCEDPFICLDDLMTYAQVTEYHDNWGIDTYVIGLGGVVEFWDQVMSNIAAYGGTGDYYPIENPETLAEALQEIAAETTECTFAVDWDALEEGASDNPDLVNLYADGNVVSYSEDCQDEHGWHWLDESTIELCPGLCHDYRWGEISEITATFGCETYVE
jgi:hypothetical protein